MFYLFSLVHFALWFRLSALPKCNIIFAIGQMTRDIRRRDVSADLRPKFVQNILLGSTMIYQTSWCSHPNVITSELFLSVSSSPLTFMPARISLIIFNLWSLCPIWISWNKCKLFTIEVYLCNTPFTLGLWPLCHPCAITKLARPPLKAQRGPRGCLGRSVVAQRTFRPRHGRHGRREVLSMFKTVAQRPGGGGGGVYSLYFG